MNTRQRFLETMCYGAPDRPPLFAEGMREGVHEAWYEQGLSLGVELDNQFTYDAREEIDIETRPRLDFLALAQDTHGLEALYQHLQDTADGRMPENWQARLTGWRDRQHVLMLMVHWGFFQSIGVQDGRTLTQAIYLLADRPDFIIEAMAIQGQCAAHLAERLLREVQIDAAIFSEPIGGNHGALVSPDMYRRFALSSYRPILDVLRRHNVPAIIWRTYANTRALLPATVSAGINCLWAVESDPQAMDYLAIRQEFGRDLRLIGGLDLDVLRDDPQAIRHSMERIIPPLLAQGGFIPLLDGRVRPDMPFKNYVYYREHLERLVGQRSPVPS